MINLGLYLMNKLWLILELLLSINIIIVILTIVTIVCNYLGLIAG
jgi:hypothetical protein